MSKHNRFELKNATSEDLNKRLLEVNKEVMILKSRAAAGTQLESPGMIGALKRSRARILTFLNKKGDIKKK
jgi:ribosomal protein L29